MLSIKLEGEVRFLELEAYDKDANYLSWEGAPLFEAKNTLNRETLRSSKVVCNVSLPKRGFV